ncbi:MAG: DUF354 domain-containing protein [Terriglobia bacterium]
MNIWIDLDNSPHIPFFAPIIKELERRGHSVTLTARDAYQVCELAALFQLKYKRVGRHYGKRTVLKAYGTLMRTLQLLPLAMKAKPDLALSHGSRAQLIASVILRVPSLSIFDYEFAKGVSFLHPTWIMAPEVIPIPAGAFRQDRVLRYPGIKEDVYVPGFRPDPGIRAQLGLSESELVVTVRPPASEAHYRNPESDSLFDGVIDFLSGRPETTVVLLPRNKRQEAAVRQKWPSLFANKKLIIPEHAVDGLNLIWNSDLVISGGGTMNREAAALGVPVYSIFRGSTGAVDRYLEAQGRLIFIKNADEIQAKIVLAHRNGRANPRNGNRPALQTIVGHIDAIVGSASTVQAEASRDLCGPAAESEARSASAAPRN